MVLGVPEGGEEEWPQPRRHRATQPGTTGGYLMGG